ncbi:MAG: hypothetical protein ACRDJ1_00900 [Actinomycetota bacterium]
MASLMPEQIEDTAYRLWWTVRRYLWVFLVTIPAAVVLLVTASPGAITTEYETSALVVATKRGDLATESMARLYESVFESAPVADEAVRSGNLPVRPQDLIPDYAAIEPVENTVAADVIGKHDDPSVAKQIADRTSEALVAELNRVFGGESVFAKVGDAPIPVSEVASVSPVTPVALGFAIGIVAGLGLIGLLFTLRRPILGGDEASALVGSPLVGTPTLPAGRGLPAVPSQVAGLAAMVKRLFPDAAGSVVFIAHARGEETRTIMAQLVAGALGKHHPTFLVSSRDQGVQHLYVQWESNPRIVVTESLPDVSTWKRMPIVIDGPSAKGTDAPQLIPDFAQIVLVVRQGASRQSVFEVASQFLPGEIGGVLFVRRGRSWPWHLGPQGDSTAKPSAAGAPASEATQQTPPKTSADPERRPSRGQDAAERAAREARYAPDRREARTRPAEALTSDAPPGRPPQTAEQASLLSQPAHRPPQQRFDGRPETMRERPERVEGRAEEARANAGDDDPVSRRDD